MYTIGIDCDSIQSRMMEPHAGVWLYKVLYYIIMMHLFSIFAIRVYLTSAVWLALPFKLPRYLQKVGALYDFNTAYKCTFHTMVFPRIHIYVIYDDFGVRVHGYHLRGS